MSMCKCACVYMCLPAVQGCLCAGVCTCACVCTCWSDCRQVTVVVRWCCYGNYVCYACVYDFQYVVLWFVCSSGVGWACSVCFVSISLGHPLAASLIHYCYALKVYVCILPIHAYNVRSVWNVHVGPVTGTRSVCSRLTMKLWQGTCMYIQTYMYMYIHVSCTCTWTCTVHIDACM